MQSQSPAPAQGQATALLQPGMVLDGKYVIGRPLDAGGMGEIFMATQRPFNRQLVIKVMKRSHAADGRLVQRFYQEAQAVARLSHPNTVTVYDFGRTDEGTLYIAMEYVPGATLGRILRETGPLPLEEAVTFAIQVAQSLGEAHYKGIIHRDLKPDNIMVVRPDGSDAFVKVLDFGIAKLTDNRGELTLKDNDVTAEGSIVGTPAYMAPEQARSSEVDGRSDLYALGCCLFEMLTGTPPYREDSPVAMLVAHQSAEIPVLPPYLPQALNRFISRVLAKDRDRRPANAAEFVAQLMGTLIRDHNMSQASESRDAQNQQDQRPTPAPISDRLRYLASSTPTPTPASNPAEPSSRMQSGHGPAPIQLPKPSQLPRSQSADDGDADKSPRSSGPSLPRPPRRLAHTQPSAIPNHSTDQDHMSTEDRQRMGVADTDPPHDAGRATTDNSTQQMDSREVDALLDSAVGPGNEGRADATQNTPVPTDPESPPAPSHAATQAPPTGKNATPEQSSPGQSSPGQSSPGQSSPGQSSPGQSSPGQSSPGQSAPVGPGLTESANSSMSPALKIVAAIALIAAGGALALLFAGDTTGGAEDDSAIAEESPDAADPAPVTVTLTIESSPTPAVVEIDGTSVGRTPLDVDLDDQSRPTITVRDEGRQSVTFEDIDLANRSNYTFFAELEARPLELQIQAAGTNASVEVNDQYLGRLDEQGQGRFDIDWPDEGLAITVEDPDLGQAFRRIPSSSIQDSLVIEFPTESFAD